MKRSFILIFIIAISIFFANCKKEKTLISEFADFQSSKDFKEGQYVLAPSFEAYQNAIEKGLDSTIFVFFPRILIEKGEKFSKITNQIDTFYLPNYLLIPLESNINLKKGDIILTWDNETFSMQKAKVVDIDSNNNPVVHFLDKELTQENDSIQINLTTDTLIGRAYTVLDNDFISGMNCYVEENGNEYLYTIININKEKVLCLKWSGVLKIFDKNECNLLKINELPKQGDSIKIPYVGIMINGIVQKVDTNFGRVWVNVNLYDQKQTLIVGEGNFKVLNNE